MGTGQLVMRRTIKTQNVKCTEREKMCTNRANNRFFRFLYSAFTQYTTIYDRRSEDLSCITIPSTKISVDCSFKICLNFSRFPQ